MKLSIERQRSSANSSPLRPAVPPGEQLPVINGAAELIRYWKPHISVLTDFCSRE